MMGFLSYSVILLSSNTFLFLHNSISCPFSSFKILFECCVSYIYIYPLPDIHRGMGCCQKDLSDCGNETSSCSSSYPMTTCTEVHVSHMCQMMIRVIIRWNRGMCTDLLGFALRRKKTLEISARWPSEDCGTNNHLKWESLPPGDVDRSTQHVREKRKVELIHPLLSRVNLPSVVSSL